MADSKDLEPLIIGRDSPDIEQLGSVDDEAELLRLGVIVPGLGNLGHRDRIVGIFGKSVGLPVWRLLGGQVRDPRQGVHPILVWETCAPCMSRCRSDLLNRSCAGRSLRPAIAPSRPCSSRYTHYTATIKDVDHPPELMQVIVAKPLDRSGISRVMVDFHGRQPASQRFAYIDACALVADVCRRAYTARDYLALKEVPQKAACPSLRRATRNRHEFDELLRSRSGQHRATGHLSLRRAARGEEDAAFG